MTSKIILAIALLCLISGKYAAAQSGYSNGAFIDEKQTDEELNLQIEKSELQDDGSEYQNRASLSVVKHNFARVTLSGNYTVGVGGDFATLTAAVAAYNSSVLNGPVVFVLINSSYPSETFPISINANAGASSINTLTIRPSLPGTVISGSASGAILVLNGADYVNVDGAVTTVANTVCPQSAAARDLKIENTSTSTSSAVIWLQSNGNDGAMHNTIQNLHVTGNSSTTTLFGIGSAGPTIDFYSFGIGNHFNKYINNRITRVKYGLYSLGEGFSAKNKGTVISQNSLDGIAPDNIGIGGILTGFEDSLVVSGNTISEILSPSAVSVVGIGIGLGMPTTPMYAWSDREVTNATVTNNKIGKVVNMFANSAVGLAVSGMYTGTTHISNNMITGVGGYGNNGHFIAGIYLGGIGLGTSGSFYVFNNTVTMTTNLAAGGHSELTAAIAIADDDPFVTLKNNIFVVTATMSVTHNRAMAFHSDTFSNLVSDNNCIYVAPGNYSAFIQWSGFQSNMFSTTMQGWRTFSGKDLNSKNVLPVFVSPADVHLVPYVGVNHNNLANTGALVNINEDIDCQDRTVGLLPDIGADEFSFSPLQVCSTLAQPVVSSITHNSFTVELPATGSYLIETGPPGFTPGLGASAGVGGTMYGPVTGSYQVTGLLSSSNYDVYVRQQCSGPVWSENSAVRSIRTTVINDECLTAIQFPSIPTGGTCVTISNQNTAGATQSLPTCLSANFTANDMWYSFIATAGVMKCTITKLTGISNPMAVQLFSGSCGNLASINCSSYQAPVIYTGLTPGNTYYIRVYCVLPDQSSEFDLCLQTVPCFPSIYLTVSNILNTSAQLNWIESSLATTWDIEIQPSPYNFTGIPTVSGVTKPYTITGLTAQTSYQVKVKPSGCNVDWTPAVAFTTIPTPPVNDQASGAILLPLGPCSIGFGHTNRNAIQSPGEPYPSCRGTEGYSTVWFKFVAPPSGAVKISNDYFSGSGSNIQANDTRVALFSATDVNDYSTFTMIACGDDGGVYLAGRTIFYAAGLTPGTTYYLQEDGCYPNHIRGQFCISVEDVASGGMITSLTSCAAARSVTANSNFTEWLSVTDNIGRLVAMVRNPGGSGSGTNTYSTNVNINAGPVRSASGTYYLDRNFQISNSAVANAEVRLFFLNSELNALTTANSQATAANLGVVRQLSSTCFGNFSSANGAFQFLPQTGNGVSPDGTLRWISFTTPGFSNFYLTSSAGYALPVSLLSFAGQREGGTNRLRWTTASESNSRGFDVQRSADGIYYESIGFVNSLAPGGNSSDQLSYSFADNNVGGRKWYYRLRLVDLDGRNSLSNVVLIKGEKPVTMSIEGIYPNPAHTKVNVMVAAPVRDKLTLVVTDMTGKNVMQQIISAEAGSNTISLDISRLTGGSYIIKLLCDNCETAVGKFVKQ